MFLEVLVVPPRTPQEHWLGKCIEETPCGQGAAERREQKEPTNLTVLNKDCELRKVASLACGAFCERRDIATFMFGRDRERARRRLYVHHLEPQAKLATFVG